jgi:hypothetical protein
MVIIGGDSALTALLIENDRINQTRSQRFGGRPVALEIGRIAYVQHDIAATRDRHFGTNALSP